MKLNLPALISYILNESDDLIHVNFLTKRIGSQWEKAIE